MKKFFTLIAGMLLVSSGAFAQPKWTNVVANGSMEGEMPTYTTYEEMQTEGAAWNSFWAHEFPIGEVGEKQYQGTATIVEDPLNSANHCARVVVRTDSAAVACENRTEAEGKLASWDCQFFIVATEPIPQGKMCRLTMRVRAEKEGSMETQAHWGPGDYNHYQLFGNLNVTTTWQTITSSEITVSADQAKEGDGKFFQTVAFNLSTTTEGNVIYFDDVKLEVKDKEDPKPFAGWLNFLRKGTLSADKIQNYTTFTGRDGAVGKDQPARIVTDASDGQPAMVVSTVAYNYHKIDSISPKYEVDEETGDTLIDPGTGEPIQAYDEETGEPAWETQEINWCITEAGDTIKNIDDWQTQFFVTVPHKFATDEKYKLVFSVRADKPTSIDTQAHTMPGGYVHWDFCGSINVTEDWQTYTFSEEDENKGVITSECNGCQTIAFNCNKTKDDGSENNIYFRFEEFSFNKDDVSDSERVLGSESVTLPLGDAKDSEVTGKIDMNEGLSVLELTDVAAVASNEKNVLLKNVKVDPEDQSEEEIFEGVQLTAGAFIDAKGNNTDALENVIILEANEESADGILEIKVTNGDIQVEEGKNVETKLVLENGDWRYLYNITFVSEETYTGINEMTTAPKANVIYDLMGRQLTKVAKGLYIMNGKKVLVK